MLQTAIPLSLESQQRKRKATSHFRHTQGRTHISLFRSSTCSRSTLMPGNLRKFLGRFRGKEFFRYFISGSIAFVADISVLVLCTEILGIHYLYSNIASYVVGLFVSYTINIKWVFEHRRFYGRKRIEFAYFTFIALFGLVTSELVLWLLTESIEIHYTWAKVASTFFVFIFNFIFKKWLLFSPARHQGPS